MPKMMTRPEALRLVKRLNQKQRLVAWALTWGWTYEEIRTCMNMSEQIMRNYVWEIMKIFKMERHGIPIVMILAEGIRKPDLADYPGVYCEPVYPEGFGAR